MKTLRERRIEAVAAAIVNARGGRRGVPPIVNVLDILPPRLKAEVIEDAAAALEAAADFDAARPG